MGRNRAFVAPTDFGSHSMLHQTLPPSSCLFAFSPSSSSSPSSPSPSLPLPICPLQSPPSTVAFYHCSQAEKEARMETVEAALKRSCLRPEMLASGPQQQQQQQSHGFLADDERVGLAGDGFSVDDLLDLGEFAEPEKEAERGGKEEAEAGETMEAENSNSNNSASSSSSALSFEPLPHPSEIPLPAHDAEELAWVSLYMDDSLSEFAPPCSAAFPPPEKSQVPAAPKLENRLGSSLPSPAPCALSTEALVPVKAKRSKRSRSASAAAWSLSGPTPFADSSSSSSTATATSSSSSSASSTPFSSFLPYDAFATNHLVDENQPQPKKHKPKKRGRKPKNSLATTTSVGMAASGELRCTHCGAQKTPQWRAGPLGAKTLCNACGVRYKSGRLLPEYRPACSPTFVSSVHSNSHRKVLEMRRKKEVELVAAATPPVPSF